MGDFDRVQLLLNELYGADLLQQVCSGKYGGRSLQVATWENIVEQIGKPPFTFRYTSNVWHWQREDAEAVLSETWTDPHRPLLFLYANGVNLWTIVSWITLRKVIKSESGFTDCIKVLKQLRDGKVFACGDHIKAQFPCVARLRWEDIAGNFANIDSAISLLQTAKELFMVEVH